MAHLHETIVHTALCRFIDNIVYDCFGISMNTINPSDSLINFYSGSVNTAHYTIYYSYNKTDDDILATLKYVKNLAEKKEEQTTTTPSAMELMRINAITAQLNALIGMCYKSFAKVFANYYANLLQNHINGIKYVVNKDLVEKQKLLKKIQSFIDTLAIRYDDTEGCFVVDSINKSKLYKAMYEEDLEKHENFKFTFTRMKLIHEHCVPTLQKNLDENECKSLKEMLALFKNPIIDTQMDKIVNGIVKKWNIDIDSCKKKILDELFKFKKSHLDNHDDEHDRSINEIKKKLALISETKIQQDEENVCELRPILEKNTRKLYLTIERVDRMIDASKTNPFVDSLIDSIKGK